MRRALPAKPPEDYCITWHAPTIATPNKSLGAWEHVPCILSGQASSLRAYLTLCSVASFIPWENLPSCAGIFHLPSLDTILDRYRTHLQGQGLLHVAALPELKPEALKPKLLHRRAVRQVLKHLWAAFRETCKDVCTQGGTRWRQAGT